jgi:hypothetical protein
MLSEILLSNNKLTSDSALASTRFSPASTLSPMASLVTGASSTSASTALLPIVIVPSITSSALRPSTAWTSTLPRSLRSA